MMAGLTLTLSVALFILHHYVAFGGLNVIEEMELEKQLQSLNKHPIKTYKTEEGDIIDCIDIYKQPALDHPALKNHKIQMRPSVFPLEFVDKTSSEMKDKHLRITPKSIDCPEHTVPIRRTQKEDLIRAKLFSKTYSTMTHPLTKLTPGKHLAIVRSVPDPETKFKGIQATFNVYNPSTKKGQSSFSNIWIENGERNVRNSLQAGWMVAPDLYGDNRTRQFSYWSVEGNPKQGCFNYLCQGFVQVDKNYGVGLPIDSSIYDTDAQNEFTLRIFQDPLKGDWWLLDPIHNITIGYWPKNIVPLLSEGGSQVVWGGQAISSSDGMSPEMGSGHFPDGNHRHGCYISQMKIFNALFQFDDPLPMKTEKFVDSTNCYNINSYAYGGPSFEYSFYFGGPGGNNCGV